MKLFEYQAKEVFAEEGVPVPRGIVVTSIDAAVDAVQTIGAPCMVKSQILRGARGKLGLVKRANTSDEASIYAKCFFESPFAVKQLLVEECICFSHEIYLSISIDPVTAQALVMLCANGGVEIEELARTRPQDILREYISLKDGPDLSVLTEFVGKTQFSLEVQAQMVNMIVALYACFCKFDAELAEINPVFLTDEGTLIAGDGKLILDDNAAFRQNRFARTREFYASDMEYESAQQGIPYIQFDGDISLMCAGAGLTTTVYDLINYEGGEVANYLEFGGPNYTKAEVAMKICLENRSSVILIVTFGTIARADIIAEGIVSAFEKLKPDRPLIACIRGTNEEVAHKILRAANIECLMDTEDAVRRAVAYAKGVKK